jgi:hypothetical protein
MDQRDPLLSFGEERIFPRALTIEEAKTLSLDALRERLFWLVEIAMASVKLSELPPGFPFNVKELSHDELLAAVEKHAYWFGPITDL